ncbi:phage major capsid protein [Candidatus Pacearchaeota archaeon]|jgi:HK97 family phage major capsid protein|nr:phage major capsid protein [Candidatus Pacearchaeota archaeon]
MKTRDELVSELAANKAKIDALFAKDVEGENDIAELEQLNAKAIELEASLSAVNRREEIKAASDARAAALKKPVTVPGNPVRSAAVIESVRDLREDDPAHGYATHRDFLSDVINASRTGQVSSQLRPLATVGSDEQGTYSDPYGGFLVPEAFLPGMRSISFEGDPTAGLTTVIPMSAPVVNIPARVDKDHSDSVSGGLRVYRRAEADTVSSSRMSMQNIRLEATALMGLSYVSEELLTESPVSFAAILAQGFNDEFAAAMLNEKINGTGAGQFLGVLASPALVSINKETGQVKHTIVYENIIKMRARCWGYQNAVWLANHDTLPQLMSMAAAIGTGGALVWHPSVVADKPDMLLGRPIYFTEFCQTVGDKGDILLANMSQFLQGTYMPVQGAESIHVRFVNHERTFKFWLKNAGSPWWSAPLTPKNSTSTLSPFVALNERA